jgi:hypothetical protein
MPFKGCPPISEIDAPVIRDGYSNPNAVSGDLASRCRSTGPRVFNRYLVIGYCYLPLQSTLRRCLAEHIAPGFVAMHPSRVDSVARS